MKVVVVGTLWVLALGACSSHSSPKPSAQPRSSTTATPTTLSPAQIAANTQARAEVTITSCAPDRRNHVSIKGTARNSTAVAETYGLQLVIRDKAGTHFYASAASVGNVAPKQQVSWDAATTAPFTPGTTCSITGVTRHSS